MSKNLSRRRLAAALPALAGLGLTGALPSLQRAHAASTPLKVGFVYTTPLAPLGWTAQHDAGRRQMERALGDRVRTRYVEKVAEGADATRVIRELAEDGNRLIITTSFGFMEPTLAVARDFPSCFFEHISGYRSAPNVGFANARFYEGRYLAGMVAAGVSRSKVAGYVAAFPIPEVIQGINAFMLGMQAVAPESSLKVLWVNSWFDPGLERAAGQSLIDQGVDVLTNHSDSPAVPMIAQAQRRWCIGYHSDMRTHAPQAQLTAVTHHWGEFYTRSALSVIEGRWRHSGLWGGLREGMIGLAPFGDAVPQALRDRVAERREAIATGRFHPFSGALQDNAGRPRQSGGVMNDETLGRMNWFVRGVQGKLPEA